MAGWIRTSDLKFSSRVPYYCAVLTAHDSLMKRLSSEEVKNVLYLSAPNLKTFAEFKGRLHLRFDGAKNANSCDCVFTCLGSLVNKAIKRVVYSDVSLPRNQPDYNYCRFSCVYDDDNLLM